MSYIFNEKFAPKFREIKKNILTRIEFEHCISTANFDSSMEEQLLAYFDSLDIDEYNNQTIEQNDLKRVLRGIIN